MISQRLLKNPLFLDIETVSCTSSFAELDERFQQLWRKKARTLGAATAEEEERLFAERAAIFSEFGKIVVIALGYISEEEGREVLSVKALYGDDEKALLLDFKRLIEQFSAARNPLQLCAHNGKEFDFPYLCRRMVVHGIPWPTALSLQGKKPWEVNHVDTKEMWKFGDYKNYTSLDLLAALFEVPSSKDLMDGSQVSHYYYEKKDLQSIMVYCRKDVVALAQVFRKMSFQPLLTDDAIRLVE
ncbi:MAG: 3'-5' exonuclease [Bacteroidota bacterium]